MKFRYSLSFSLLLLFMAANHRPAQAWWDTRLIARRPVPLVKEFPAASCIAAGAAAVRRDAQANGGQGGQVVVMEPGGAALQAKFEVTHGVYSLFLVARSDAKFADDAEPAASVTLTVTPAATGVARHWSMPVFYLNNYEAIARMYFPADYDGAYTATMSMDASSKMSFLADRLELRNAVGSYGSRGVKTRRMLKSDAEVAELRDNAAAREAAATDKTRSFNNNNITRFALNLPEPFRWIGTGNMPERTPQQRLEDGAKFWGVLPDFNAQTIGSETEAYAWVIGHNVNGVITDGARLYEAYGDKEAAWNSAVFLCSLAQKYPGLDLQVQGTGKVFASAKNRFTFGDGQVGKFVYSGWATPDLMHLAIAYDELFDYIKDNQVLASFVGTKIPWVKTPADVIALIDTHVLQCGMDAFHRRQLEDSDDVGALVPLVEGVNDVSRRMMEENLFGRVDMGMTDAGGVDDQAFSAYSTDGMRYIGSTGYIGDELSAIARETHQYVQAGGDDRFDLQNELRYPQIGRVKYTIDATNVAGGFPIIIGDSRDLHVGRANPQTPALPSRALGGFGLAILEDGQNAVSNSAKRAVSVRTGLGVGHSHQDTLNLDITALGCRLAPDLGGRDEGHNRGWPNMRVNRSHNVVEVDGHDLMNNESGSSITSGTAWTRWMVPAPQCQVMTNTGRGSSHPNVSLYERTTAMVDGPEAGDTAPLYVFDVFRVAGGKQHTFCFHGAESDEFTTNAPLQPATGEAANFLSQHKEGTRQQGVVPDVLDADWRLNAANEKEWLGASDEAQRRHSRFSLLGQNGDALMVGNAYSNAYKYDFPFLYAQRKQETEGLQSAFVSLVECYAGKPFIASKKLLEVTPRETDARAGVGVRLMDTNGRKDVLFSSGHPDHAYILEGGGQVSGEFGFSSTDADGLRQVQLVGGTHLKMGDFAIDAAAAGYSGKITGVDYEHRLLTVDAAIPPAVLAGEVALIGNEKHLLNFNLKSAAKVPGGTRLECVETPKFFQSNILALDEKTHDVIPELEPAAIRADPFYYEGATVSNSNHTAFWKAHVATDGLWMNIGWPGYRTSVLNTLSLKDLPDAEGAGGATLRMMEASADNAPEKEVAKLQVTRVDEKQGTFYFKTPQEPKLQNGGWSYVGYTLRNSDGSKAWRSLYAGVSYRFVLQGAPAVNQAAFAEPGGQSKLSIYHYGPGDTVMVPTHVQVRRIALGEYEVRTNVACSLTLPGAAMLERQLAGNKWAALPAVQKGNAYSVNITAEMLTGKPIHLRIKPKF